ncbi:MAG: DUF881 domain-containing protein [Clostridia bacterium]|nr:DUF881 domain-containing protein [Clostridia bacterium]
MLNKKIISSVLGLMCFALTLGICVQIKTVKGTNSTVSNNYEENSLRAEVLKYKEKYENKYKELERAEKTLEKERQNATQNNSELEKKEEEITQGNKILGLAEVTGPGVTVTLTDSKKDINSALDPSSLVVHDLDVLSVINELKNAGAEAISINDQRIIPTSGIICGGNIIDVNNEKVGAPFVIKAIGLPEQLAALSRPGGYLERLKDDSIGVELKKSNHITIPKYTGTLTYHYAKTIE